MFGKTSYGAGWLWGLARSLSWEGWDLPKSWMAAFLMAQLGELSALRNNTAMGGMCWRRAVPSPEPRTKVCNTCTAETYARENREIILREPSDSKDIHTTLAESDPNRPKWPGERRKALFEKGNSLAGLEGEVP